MSVDREQEIGKCIFREANDAFFLIHPETLQVVDANPAAQRLTGRRKKQLQSQTLTELLADNPPEKLTEILEACRRTKQHSSTVAHSFLLNGGARRQLQISVSRIHLENEALGLLVVRDVTRQKDAEDALLRGEERYHKLADKVRLIPWESLAEPRQFTYVGPQAAVILGYSVEQWKRPGFWEKHLHPEDREATLAAYRKGCAAVADFECEYRMRSAAGQDVWMHDVLHVIAEERSPLRLHGFLMDITERKTLEEDLRQSQKLEAIGRLANGVAHDFNNLLTVISGYCGFLLSKIKSDSPWREAVAEIRKAAERGVALTGQLLAFGRKQKLQPQRLNVPKALAEIQQMLRRLIGENIELNLLLDDAIGPVKFDPRQFELAVMNLALNARDAMPKGGKLTIAARPLRLDAMTATHFRELKAGAYVLLSVSDTGFGMDEATRQRIFEPFFTTKELGRGTGLGLATVYGIVKQSGGHIEATSQPSRGTTFSIYLPVCEEEFVSRGPAAAPPVALEVKGGTETVLLVEDEADLRRLTGQILKQFGYTVIDAENGSAAMAVQERHPETIDLLLTDVVMPLMGGPQLAEELRRLRPKMRVLFMSGYSDTNLPGLREAEPAPRLLPKPFMADTLARAVRDALDAK